MGARTVNFDFDGHCARQRKAGGEDAFHSAARTVVNFGSVPPTGYAGAHRPQKAQKTDTKGTQECNSRKEV